MSPARGGRLPRNGAVAVFCALALSVPTLSGAITGLTEVLGIPTDTSVSLSVEAAEPFEAYVEYGDGGGGWPGCTASAVSATGGPLRFELSPLEPDRGYAYRSRIRRPGETAFAIGAEHRFHTQRAPGSPFTFGLQGDSHPERASQFDGELYARTLATVAADRPDFYLTIGDDFSIDALQNLTADTVEGRYTLQLPYLGTVGSSAPLFLVNGNHEQAARYLLDGTPDNPAVWAQNARNRHYPQPAPDRFYTGNAEEVPYIGLLRNRFAWSWGDALFVTIDPYWSSPVAVDNRLDGGPKTADKWQITLGDDQYFWLKKTLEESRAKWKFVFAHHVGGAGRGGIETSHLYEWGGENADGSWGFTTHRPNWPLTVHQLFVANHVTIFFQGHDHLFARQERDGVVYQELPEPADPSYTLWNSDAYQSGDRLPNTGYVRVNVSASAVEVEYVKTYLPKDEDATRHNGEVAFGYRILADSSPPVAAFSFLPAAPSAGEMVQFTDASTGSPTSWSWSFGDGATSDRQNPLHPFAAAGSYEVTLEAANAGGSSRSTRTVTVGAGVDPACPGSNVYVVPAGAHSAGAGGTAWVTDLALQDAAGTGATVRLELLERDRDNSNPVFTTMAIAPSQQRLLPDLFAGSFGRVDVAAALRVCSDRPLRVMSRTFNQSPAGTFGQGIPGFPEAEAIPAGSAGHLMFLSEGAKFRTNVGLVNAGAATVGVDVELYDSSGGLLGTKHYALRPYESIQRSRIFTEVTANEVAAGSAAIRPTGGAVFAYASLVDNATGDPTFMNAEP